MSQRQIGYVNVMDTQHAVCLQRKESGPGQVRSDVRKLNKMEETADSFSACSDASVPWNYYMWEDLRMGASGCAIPDRPGITKDARNVEVIWSTRG